MALHAVPWVPALILPLFNQRIGLLNRQLHSSWSRLDDRDFLSIQTIPEVQISFSKVQERLFLMLLESSSQISIMYLRWALRGHLLIDFNVNISYLCPGCVPRRCKAATLFHISFFSSLVLPRLHHRLGYVIFSVATFLLQDICAFLLWLSQFCWYPILRPISALSHLE